MSAACTSNIEKKMLSCVTLLDHIFLLVFVLFCFGFGFLFATKCNFQNREEIKENSTDAQRNQQAYAALVLPQLMLN